MWLLLLSMMPSRSIHVVIDNRISFLRLNDLMHAHTLVCVCVYKINTLSDIIGKNIPSYHRLPFHLVDLSFFCEEALLDVMPFVCFAFVAFAFGAKSKPLPRLLPVNFPICFFQELYGFRSYIQIFFPSISHLLLFFNSYFPVQIFNPF